MRLSFPQMIFMQFSVKIMHPWDWSPLLGNPGSTTVIWSWLDFPFWWFNIVTELRCMVWLMGQGMERQFIWALTLNKNFALFFSLNFIGLMFHVVQRVKNCIYPSTPCAWIIIQRRRPIKKQQPPRHQQIISKMKTFILIAVIILYKEI